jgi:hypothetical protein
MNLAEVEERIAQLEMELDGLRAYRAQLLEREEREEELVPEAAAAGPVRSRMEDLMDVFQRRGFSDYLHGREAVATQYTMPDIDLSQRERRELVREARQGKPHCKDIDLKEAQYLARLNEISVYTPGGSKKMLGKPELCKALYEAGVINMDVPDKRPHVRSVRRIKGSEDVPPVPPPRSRFVANPPARVLPPLGDDAPKRTFDEDVGFFGKRSHNRKKIRKTHHKRK